MNFLILKKHVNLKVLIKGKIDEDILTTYNDEGV
ncbi:MAG: hypothetical protein CM15mL5_0560 [uncultured marine virus]|nr:MAG: hypothetical protein CM15mL5_0560 [uncultured marine virus]